MEIDRRKFIAATALIGAVSNAASGVTTKDSKMLGLIGKISTQPGRRRELVNILLDRVAGMPGCLSYVVAEDSSDPDLLWITEVWETKEAHAASLRLPSVKEAIAKGRPLIAGMTSVAETTPVGGVGLEHRAQ